MPLLYTQRGFRKAIAKGDAVLVARYLSRESIKGWLHVSLDEEANSALHIAAMHGNRAVADVLLKAGAEIERPNIQGITPLGVAAMNRSPDMVEMLTENGADIDTTTPLGNLLLTAIQNYAEESALVILEKRPSLASGAALREAVRHGYENLTVKLLEAGMFEEGNAKNPPLLHMAATSDKISIARALLKYGADVNAKDTSGNTALHQAADAYWNRDMLRFLADNGARPDIKNDTGETPLDLALRYGSSDTSKILVGATDKLLAKNTTPVTAEAGRMPDESAEEWILMGDTQVARVGLYPATGRRLTHIFNFESRERIIISENLKTGAENITQPEKFDTLEEAHVASALEAYRKLGGKADDAAVFGARMTKKQIPGPGGQ